MSASVNTAFLERGHRRSLGYCLRGSPAPAAVAPLQQGASVSKSWEHSVAAPSHQNLPTLAFELPFQYCYTEWEHSLVQGQLCPALAGGKRNILGRGWVQNFVPSDVGGSFLASGGFLTGWSQSWLSWGLQRDPLPISRAPSQGGCLLSSPLLANSASLNLQLCLLNSDGFWPTTGSCQAAPSLRTLPGAEQGAEQGQRLSRRWTRATSNFSLSNVWKPPFHLRCPDF